MISRRLERRAAALLSAVAVAAGSAAALLPQARASAAASASALHAGGTVTLSSQHADAQRQAANPPSHRTARTPAPQHAQRTATLSGSGHVYTIGHGATGPQVLGNVQVEEQLQDFAGVSHDEQVGALGNRQAVTPPDTQLAVGPDHVVEMGNSSVVIMGKHGENRQLSDEYVLWASMLTAANAATSGSSYALSDPRVLYDAESQRFFTSILAFDTNSGTAATSPSFVGLARSATDAPTTWTVWWFQSAADQLDDQPLLGIDTDKVVLSWNMFDNVHPNTCDFPAQAGGGQAVNPNSAQVLVVDKGDLLTGVANPATAPLQSFTAPDGVQSLVPAISETSTTTAWLVYNREDLNCAHYFTTWLGWSQVGVVPITGKPHDNGNSDTTAFGTEADYTYTENGTITWFAPPFATQPGANSPQLDTSDGRMQSVVLQNNVLATAGSVALEVGPNQFVSALLTARVHIDSSTFDWATLTDASNDIFDPAVALDGNGLGHFTFTWSGSQLYASASALSFNWAGGVFGADTFRTGRGNGVYGCNSCLLGGNVMRWGDYSSIAVDPANTDDVWAAAEFAANTGSNWGTSIARLTSSTPKVSSISVSSGRTSGGAVVTITGNDFDPASSGTLFGGTDSLSVQWLDPEHLVAVAPQHAAGAVNVQATSIDGASAPVAGDVFTYVLPPLRSGYWLVATDGGIFSYNAAFHGSTGNIHLNQPIVGMAAAPDGGGYWLVASDGGIFAFGTAGFHGSTGNIRLNKPVVGMAATPSGNGYWLVASDGGIFAFGDAKFYGSTGNIRLNQPIVGMAAAPDGAGYWLVASDGGIFAFGPHAGFHGSAGNIRLNQPIVGMAPTSTGGGYWLVATDGGIFSYGDAGFHGSAGNIHLNKPIVGMSASGDDGGYWLVATDGGIFSYGDAGFHGSAGNIHLNQPIVGMASVPA